MVKISNENMKVLVKCLSVVSSGNLVLNAVKAGENTWGLTAISQTLDQTQQVVKSVLCEKGSMKKDGETFGCVVKNSEFVAIAGMVCGTADEDVSLVLKGNKLVVKNSAIELEQDVLAERVEPVQADEKNHRLLMKVGRLDLLHLIKDAGKFWDETSCASTVNTVWHTTKNAVSISSCSGKVYAYDTVPAIVVPGPAWDKACESFVNAHPDMESGCDTAVPGIFLGALMSVLGITDKEIVDINMDDKYLHLLYDENAMLSVRLAAQPYDVVNFQRMIAAPVPAEIAVDKALFDNAVKVIHKRIDMSGELSKGVAVHLISEGAGNKAIIVAKVGENRVDVPIVAGAGDGVDVDVYLNPKFLEAAIASARGGNIVLKLTDQYVVLCNGTVGEEFAPGNTKIFLYGITHKFGEAAEARFVSGVVGEETEKKSKKSKKVEEE